MTKHGKRLVVDTDIIRSAGNEKARDPRSVICRDFLRNILAADELKIILTDAVLEEWRKHLSTFSRTWLTSMYARKRVERIDVPFDVDLREKISTLASSTKKQEAMLKDTHLLEAAMKADKTIFSIDETVRGYFQEIAPGLVILKDIIWINPCKYTACFIWLQSEDKPKIEYLLCSI